MIVAVSIKFQDFYNFDASLICTVLLKPVRFVFFVIIMVCFPQFFNHFLTFSMVFPHVSLGVSTISSGVSIVSS